MKFKFVNYYFKTELLKQVTEVTDSQDFQVTRKPSVSHPDKKLRIQAIKDFKSLLKSALELHILCEKKAFWTLPVKAKRLVAEVGVSTKKEDKAELAKERKGAEKGFEEDVNSNVVDDAGVAEYSDNDKSDEDDDEDDSNKEVSKLVKALPAKKGKDGAVEVGHDISDEDKTHLIDLLRQLHLLLPDSAPSPSKAKTGRLKRTTELHMTTQKKVLNMFTNAKSTVSKFRVNHIINFDVDALNTYIAGGTAPATFSSITKLDKVSTKGRKAFCLFEGDVLEYFVEVDKEHESQDWFFFFDGSSRVDYSVRL